MPRWRRSAWHAALLMRCLLRDEIGAAASIGKTPGRVVRHFEDGFAIEFVRLQHSCFVEESVTGG